MVTVKKSVGARAPGSAAAAPSPARPLENVAELIRSKDIAKLSEVCRLLALAALPDSYLVSTLEAVQETIISFDRSLQFFIQVLLKVEWTTKQRETRNVYRKTMLEFVAAHNWCLNDVLAAFIGRLRTTKFTVASLDGTTLQNSAAKLHSDEAVFSEIHDSLVELGRLVPLSPTFHVETIEQLAPYGLNGQQLFAHFAYARNALRLGDDFSQNRKGVLNWFVSMLLQIDLNMTTDKPSLRCHEHEPGLRENFRESSDDPFREVHFAGDTTTSCANLYETGDVLDFLRSFYSSLFATSTSSAAEASTKGATPSPSFATLSNDELNVIKLDLLLSLLFDYFDTLAKRCAKQMQSNETAAASSTLVKAGSKRKRTDSSSSGSREREQHAIVNAAYLEAFDEFLAVFGRQVLALDGHPTCVQFSILWMCSLLSDARKADPKATRHSHRLEISADLRTRLCAFLWKKFEQLSENLFVRCNAVQYLVDFLARFSDVDYSTSGVDLVRDYLAKLCEFAHSYAGRVVKENAGDIGNAVENAKKHAVYYAAVRSAAFLLAYRQDALLNDVSFLATLRLQSLVTAPLNPLLFCDSHLVSRFSRVAHTMQIAYVDNVIERNRRLLYSLMTQSNTPSDGEQLALKLGFHSAFPFHSMPLISLSRYIIPIFRQYEEAITCDSSVTDKMLDSQLGEDEDEEVVAVEYASRGKRQRTRTICSD